MYGFIAKYEKKRRVLIIVLDLFDSNRIIQQKKKNLPETRNCYLKTKQKSFVPCKQQQQLQLFENRMNRRKRGSYKFIYKYFINIYSEVHDSDTPCAFFKCVIVIILNNL